MEIIIKASNLEVNQEEYETIKSDLEKLAKVKPSNDVEKFSETNNWSIDQKDIIITSRSPISYRVEFYHNEKDGDKKKCYMGSLSYNSPVELNK
jgi:hypothetical protein